MSAPDFSLRAVVPAPPEPVFDAWVDGATHAAFTGAPATSDPRPGGAFTAWGDYISGTWVELERPTRLVMRWRTAQFAASDPDATVVVELVASAGGTSVSLTQTSSPAGQAESYEKGWEEYYFTPLRSYFT